MFDWSNFVAYGMNKIYLSDPVFLRENFPESGWDFQLDVMLSGCIMNYMVVICIDINWLFMSI